MDNRTIAEFSLNEIVGFEEIMRQKVLDQLKKEWMEDEANRHVRNREEKMEEMFTDPSTMQRNFTCIVKSLTATLYFLKVEDFNIFFKFIPKDQVRKGVENRMNLLKHQMSTIRQICEDDYRKVTKLERVEAHRG